MYHKFLIGEVDHFDAAQYPELQKSLVNISGKLAREPNGLAADMLLSFVKDHRINSQLVMNHPELAALISTKELPLGIMEDLFDASRKNPSFSQELESHIRSGLDHANTNKKQ
ncbi:MAG: hypothetical protein EOO01_08390 [Chitinophagaceae bacterium]|nr:MAG: hypothetical protein EOO01_08390 [Chitinophagaceae bacterium]